MLKQISFALFLVGTTVAVNAQDKVAPYGKAAAGQVKATNAVKGKAGNVASTIVITSTHTREVDMKGSNYGKAAAGQIQTTNVVKGKAGNVASTIVITSTHTREVDVKASKISGQ